MLASMFRGGPHCSVYSQSAQPVGILIRLTVCGSRTIVQKSVKGSSWVPGDPGNVNSMAEKPGIVVKSASF